MEKFRVAVDSESDEQQSVVVLANTPQDAVAIACGRGDIPLDQPVRVKYVEYSDKGEVIHRAGKTDETQLQIDLLVRISESKIIQEPFSAVFWPVIAGLVVFSILSIILGALFQLG